MVRVNLCVFQDEWALISLWADLSPDQWGSRYTPMGKQYLHRAHPRYGTTYNLDPLSRLWLQLKEVVAPPQNISPAQLRHMLHETMADLKLEVIESFMERSTHGSLHTYHTCNTLTEREALLATPYPPRNLVVSIGRAD